jgi:hypothetical protein
MTSFRQIEANRRNATKSTGPSTADGKRRSRRNALRHGLCAETVVEIVEDIEDYKEFEAAVIADYDARTAVERELVLRLASLLWRLRRSTAIETDLLRIQAEIMRDRRRGVMPDRPPHVLFPILGSTHPIQRKNMTEQEIPSDSRQADADLRDHASRWSPQRVSPARQLALCFQRLANLDNTVFERLGRYELALSRQIVQTLFLLRSSRGR